MQKNNLKIFSFLLMTMLLAWSNIACDYYGDSTHPYIKKATMLETENRPNEAIAYYKKFLNSSPKDTQIHIKIALIYDEQLNDYLSAIYHYKEYLAQNPEAQNANLVREWIKLCEENYLKTQNVEDEKVIVEKEEVVEVVEPLKEEKSEEIIVETPPTQEIVKVVQKVEIPPVTKKVEVIETVKEESPKVHIVNKGDTLSHISLRYYGSAKQFKKIMEYNNLKSANDLKIGQKILIPKLNDRE